MNPIQYTPGAPVTIVDADGFFTSSTITGTDVGLLSEIFPMGSNRLYTEAREFVDRHGFDANEVTAIRYEVIDCPALTFYVLDDAVWATEHPRNHRWLPAMHTSTTTVALRGELPSWWRPEET